MKKKHTITLGTTMGRTEKEQLDIMLKMAEI
jgi:hypothetical protein